MVEAAVYCCLAGEAGFGHELHVDLSALTLQPIVENAVRYGVTKRPEGGAVTIATRETDRAYIVTVADDGMGFDPMRTHEDGRTHIAMSIDAVTSTPPPAEGGSPSGGGFSYKSGGSSYSGSGFSYNYYTITVWAIRSPA